MSASAYERYPLTGGEKCRALAEKLLGPKLGVHLWKVSAYNRLYLVHSVLIEKILFFV